MPSACPSCPASSTTASLFCWAQILYRCASVCPSLCEAAALAGMPEQLLAVGTASSGPHRVLALITLTAIVNGVADKAQQQLRGGVHAQGMSLSALGLAPSAETDGAIARLAGADLRCMARLHGPRCACVCTYMVHVLDAPNAGLIQAASEEDPRPPFAAAAAVAAYLRFYLGLPGHAADSSSVVPPPMEVLNSGCLKVGDGSREFAYAACTLIRLACLLGATGHCCNPTNTYTAQALCKMVNHPPSSQSPMLEGCEGPPCCT